MVIDFLQHDALAVADLIRRKEISPRDAVQASINRIEALNPRLNAVVHQMFDRALATADNEIPDGPFRGVPFLLKDLTALYEGEPITSGSRLFKGWVAPYDSEMTRRYKRAGLIVVGKTNTPEFGLVPFTESELLGICRNPWNPAVHDRRLVRRVRRRGRQRHGPHGRRRRWRRVAPHSGIVLWRVWPEADARSHSNRANAG
jgi:Asp-tRNA(Asn)/Glu-tRNA(Gln) amidotransferase A subunit family amidase